MSHVNLRDAGGHDSGCPQVSRQHLRPFEAMLIKLEELVLRSPHAASGGVILASTGGLKAARRVGMA